MSISVKDLRDAIRETEYTIGFESIYKTHMIIDPKPVELYQQGLCKSDDDFCQVSLDFAKHMMIDPSIQSTSSSAATAIFLIENSSSVSRHEFTTGSRIEYQQTAFVTMQNPNGSLMRHPVMSNVKPMHHVVFSEYSLPEGNTLINVMLNSMYYNANFTYLLTNKRDAILLHTDTGRYKFDRDMTYEIQCAMAFFEPNADTGIDEDEFFDIVADCARNNRDRLVKHHTHYQHYMWLRDYMMHYGNKQYDRFNY